MDALKAKDVERADQCYATLRRAGMGSFLDWFPPPVFDYEDGDYVEAVWNALYGQWAESMERIKYRPDA
ncbi:MAG: hypothetical protein IPI83_14170 [Sphingomonadales bacterium]|nr:hypothetical protein [Sphingomonadales bacterium]